MLNNVLKNIENNIVMYEDVKYIWNLEDSSEILQLIEIIDNREEKHRIKLESNVYYPLIYQIEDNCPTCGYRTPVSRQKYTEEFIVKNIEYRLSDLNNYDISGINCYNKDITGLHELFIILSCLKGYDVDINVALSNYDNLDVLRNQDINSIIYVPPLPQAYAFNENSLQKNNSYEEETIRYIKEDMDLKVTYQLILNYNERPVDIYEKILKLKKLGVDIIEITGYNPFIDTPEEYHPQYTKESILKIILMLKLYIPKAKLKIRYASNGNNHIETFIKLNVEYISGIYTPNMNSKLSNIEKMKEFIKE